MRKAPPFIFLLFLLIVPLSFSTDYPYPGDDTQDYRSDQGFWNEQMTSDIYQTATRGLDTPKQMPLVADLDNDGTNEIIILAGNRVRLFSSKSLTAVDAFTLPTSTHYSNMYIYDIDGDSRPEVLISEEDLGIDSIHVLGYNGSLFTNESAISMTGSSTGDGQKMIACKDIDDCILVFVVDDAPAAANGEIYAIPFTRNSKGTEVLIESLGPVGTKLCFSKIRNIVVDDYDNDGDTEYIFTFLRTATQEEIWTNIIYHNGSTILEELQIQDTSPGNSFTSGDCNKEGGHLLTSPLVKELDGSASNGKEILVGMSMDPDEFQLVLYESSSGNELDDYPEVTNGNGLLISNPILINAFEDTNTEDFCVFGYNNDIAGIGFIELVCGSYLTGESPSTRTWTYTTTGTANLTTNSKNWSSAIHAVQMSSETYDGSNFDEIVTSFGVFTISRVSALCELVGTCVLQKIWDNPQHPATVLPVDYEQVGRSDLIMITGTNLWYYDDGYSKSGGNISDYYVNPCLDATWKVNTSVEARITANDPDGDTVQAKAILYYGDDNEQDGGWSSLTTSGTTFAFNFIANKTISVGTLRLVARDSDQPTDNSTLDLSFTVGTNGVEFNDCTTEVDISDEEDAVVTGTIDADLTNNSITNGVNTVGELTGLGSGLMWILIMFIVGLVIWVTTPHDNFQTTNTIFGVVVILEFFLVILGVKLGFIDIGILLSVVVIGIVGIGLWLRSRLAGLRTD